MKKQLFFLLLFLSFNGIYAQVLTATSIVTQPLCFGDSNGGVTVSATGGTAPYTYSISPNSGAVLSANVFSNLSPGTYIVTVFDSSTPQQQINLTVTLTQPSPLNVTASVSGNTITAYPTGGNAPYQFSLNGPGPFQSSPLISNVLPGSYLLIVKDMNGCMVSDLVTVPSIDLQIASNYVDYNNDGFTNVGDVINYQFTITNNDSLSIFNVALSSLEININGSLATLSPVASDSTSFTATHVVTQQDIVNGSFSINIQGSAHDLTNATILPFSATDTELFSFESGIKLNAFIDANANGIQDSGEQNFTQGNFQYQINDDGINHNIATSTGIHYLYESNPANSYDLSYSIGNVANPLQYSLGISSYSNVTVASGSGITTYNFPVTVLPHKDLAITLTPFGPSPRPGFTYVNRLAYKNNGSETIGNGSLSFTKDNALTIISISQSGTVSGANGFTYNFTNLLPGEVRYIDVTMQVPTIPTVALGQLITNNASGLVFGTDINSSNNTSNLSQIIIGSYDPNDKTESHGGRILHSSFTANDYLTYTIQFENTGTANAVNVRVNDVLDSKLDETSVKMINASHAYVFDRVGGNLTWKFNGIELGSSVANTAIGKGYITFQIKPKPGYAVGDIIPNTASIYFDFNPAIVTNTFNTEFVSTLSVSNFENESFTVYPNPTNGLVSIKLKDNTTVIDQIIVCDVLGKKVKTKSFKSSNVMLDLSDLNKGVYFIKLQSGELEKIVKVVKQ